MTSSSPVSQAAVSTQQLSDMTSSSPDMGGDEDEALMSAEVLWRSFSIMDQVLYTLEVIGLVINAINIAVMTRPSMRSPTSTFLVALSVLQFLYICIRFIPAIHGIFQPPLFTDFFFLINSIYINNYGLTCLRRSMYCIQCFISAERLLAVWLPLKAKQFLLVRRPWLFILTTPAVVFLAHVYYPFRIDVFQTTDSNNQTIFSFRYSQHYRRHPEFFNLSGIVTKVVFVYVILLTLMVLNLAMIVVIKRSTSVRKMMKTNQDQDVAQRRESQMTLTILVSTLIFVVLCLPTASSSLAADTAPKSYGPFTPQRNLFLFMNKFAALLFTLAFSTDFFTYVSLSSAYRNTLLRMFKRRQKPEVLSAAEVRSSKDENAAWS